MAKCPVCKEFIDGYEWKPTKSGKKWLFSASGKGHDCPKSTSKFKSNETYVKRIPLIDKNFIFCNLCGNWLLNAEAHEKYPKLHYISMEVHIKTSHPNGEILDDIDFKAVSNNEKERIRIKWNQPKRTTPYKLIGKFVS